MMEGLRAWSKRCRRRLARFIEPDPLDPDGLFEIPISVSFQGAAALREQLGVDEESYLRVAGQSWADARSYVLYTALDEVEKTAVYLMRLREYLGEDESIHPGRGRLSRVVLSQLLEEQQARLRRMLELLVVLVLFTITNTQANYRHMLLLEELNDLLSANQDLKDFYGARSANIDESIERQVAWIRNVEKEVDSESLWYARGVLPDSAPEGLYPGRLMSSMRQRVRQALEVMTAGEKLLFGYSYSGWYGESSDAVHFVPNRKDYRLQGGEETAFVGALGMLCFAVLARCHELLGRPEISILNNLQQNLAASDAGKLLDLATVRSIEEGDFVLAYGDLAEVMEVKESDYSYRSYRVRYLADKPKPDIEEDWFPARHVVRLYTKEKLLAGLQRLTSEGKVSSELVEDMKGLDDEELQAALRESLIHTWELGLRDWFRAQGDSGS